jgi:L-rhamnose mutarotase
MRQAWVMKLKPGHEAIYKKKHDEIWPELVEMMRRDGIRNLPAWPAALCLPRARHARG